MHQKCSTPKKASKLLNQALGTSRDAKLFFEGMIMKPERLFVVSGLAILQLLFYTGTALANDEGQAIYTAICSACHAPENVMVSSPKAGDRVEWNKRLAKGLEAATDNAVNGFGAMPPKGGATELSREQIRLAIQYMAASRK
jgi:cytochrome c5